MPCPIQAARLENSDCCAASALAVLALPARAHHFSSCTGALSESLGVQQGPPGAAGGLEEVEAPYGQFLLSKGQPGVPVPEASSPSLVPSALQPQ